MMAQMTVGLDLGSQSIKRVRLKSSFRTLELVDFVQFPIPMDERPRFERIQEVLQQLKAEHRPTDLLATSLPGDEVSLRILNLPFYDRKKIEQTIGFELESQIPFGLEEIVYNYLVLKNPNAEGSRILSIHSPIEVVKRFLGLLQECGMDPRFLSADSLAYGSLLEYLPCPEDQAIAVVDIGHRLSACCILGPNGIQFARSLNGGGLDITNALAEVFKVDSDRAEAGKKREAFVQTASHPAKRQEETLIAEAVEKALSPVLLGLSQTFAAYRRLKSYPISKIWLCGGGAAVRNLDGFLSEKLEFECERLQSRHFDIPGARCLDDPEGFNRWVKPLGLALHAHQAGRSGFVNLRRGPFAFKGDFQEMRGKMTYLSAGILFLLLLAIGSAVVHYVSLSASLKSVEQQAVEITGQILGKPYPDLEAAIAVMKERSSPKADPLPKVTALDIFREIHQQIPMTSKLRFREINISSKKIQIEGFTENYESVEQIKTALEKYKCFTEVRTGKTEKIKEEVRFEISIAFGC